MTESVYEFVMDELEKTRGRWLDIARDTGISISTIKKIGYREVENPGVLTIEKLAAYFREQPAAA